MQEVTVSRCKGLSENAGEQTAGKVRLGERVWVTHKREADMLMNGVETARTTINQGSSVSAFLSSFLSKSSFRFHLCVKIIVSANACSQYCLKN